MRICLINPPSPFLLDDRVFPPLGLLQVAAALEQAGHGVEVADLAGYAEPWSELERYVKSRYEVYGFTATTPQFPASVDLCSRIRESQPEARIIIGGPHATVMPESCGMFDCIVRGDGEEAILEAIYPTAEKIIDQATNTQNGELKWLWPARKLIDMPSYKYRLAGRPGTSMMWSMGCPYGCLYCCGRTVPFYRRVRSRNPEDVASEARHLADTYGVGSVTAFDDEVNLLNEPLLGLCAALEPLQMRFRGFVKANLFTDVQAAAMARAGFVEVCTGVESADNRVLGIMGKQTTREINTRFVQLARKHGMRSKAFLSIGHPGETESSVRAIQSWLMEARPDDFDVTVITVYPGTVLWDKKVQVGMQDDGHTVFKYTHTSRRPEEDQATLFFQGIDYSKEFAFYKGKPKEYVSHVWTPDLSPEDLVRLRDEMEDTGRRELGVPYPKRYSGDALDTVAPSLEHSMGQSDARGS